MADNDTLHPEEPQVENDTILGDGKQHELHAEEPQVATDTVSNDEKQHGINAEQPKVDMDTNSIELHKSVTVDTLHNDEAVKVLANYDGDQSWEEEEEKRLRRKIDRKLLPILCLTYAVQYYDKSMLSQAAIFGLRTDLHLETGNRYSFTAAIFYLGFVAGAYPAIVMAQRFPIERVAFIIVFCGASALHARPHAITGSQSMPRGSS
ncbi:hypothetical protein LTS07_009021 [Exophiala sideris]|nr:hypothetical protein LTS07_009021 [Exophiala sideris]KAK5179376.1 hypothetical protein LTR44_008214 [Eurotiomycetes sp. CCFEE 6388]